jgi:Raf kinase inhibitor-like YbhB/YbcL family protein
MDDPDAPSGVWNHWRLWNIPHKWSGLEEGVVPEPPVLSGMNDFRKPGYGGPCPPKGHGPHRYFFRLFAIDVDDLGLPVGARRAELDSALASHALATAEYMGRYERRLDDRW